MPADRRGLRSRGRPAPGAGPDARRAPQPPGPETIQQRLDAILPPGGLTPLEVARMFRVRVRWIWQLIAKGLLPAHRLGQFVIRPEPLQATLQAGCSDPAYRVRLEEVWLHPRELAPRLGGITENWLVKLLAQGRLPGVHLGKKWFIPLSVVEERARGGEMFRPAAGPAARRVAGRERKRGRGRATAQRAGGRRVPRVAARARAAGQGRRARAR